MSLVLLRIRSHLLILGAVAALAVLVLGALAVIATGDAKRASDPTAKGAAAAKPEVGEMRPEQPAARGAPTETCASCGAVEAIRTVEMKTDATGAGADSSPDLEKTASKRVVYRVTVRMDDRSYRTLSQSTPPSVAVGEKVRLVDGAVVARK
jgi:hypothetical protein